MLHALASCRRWLAALKTDLFTNEDGFSMTELMVVLVIIGILTLIALPRFMNITTKAKMTEAKMALKQVHALAQAYYFEHDAYTTDLALIGYEQNPTVEEGGTARYTLSIEHAEGNQMTAIATAIVDFDKDGSFNVWEVNQDGIITERTPD